MVDPPPFDGRAHRALAIEANNSTWELLDGRPLTDAETDDLLERAHAAAYHWRRAADATTINQARAAWLLSRVFCVARHGALALHHAQRCIQLTEEAGADAADFDMAYAHEATARAYACLGDHSTARAALEAARAVEIADDEDRQIVSGDLASGPWFGLSDANPDTT